MSQRWRSPLPTNTGTQTPTYELYDINRAGLENLIHRIFGAARRDIEMKDHFGQPVIPRERFLVPLFVIDEAVERIKDGTITGYCPYRKLKPERNDGEVRRGLGARGLFQRIGSDEIAERPCLTIGAY
jgi:hypothetical protein